MEGCADGPTSGGCGGLEEGRGGEVDVCQGAEEEDHDMEEAAGEGGDEADAHVGKHRGCRCRGSERGVER